MAQFITFAFAVMLILLLVGAGIWWENRGKPSGVDGMAGAAFVALIIVGLGFVSFGLAWLLRLVL